MKESKGKLLPLGKPPLKAVAENRATKLQFLATEAKLRNSNAKLVRRTMTPSQKRPIQERQHSPDQRKCLKIWKSFNALATEKIDVKHPKFDFSIGKVAEKMVDIEVQGHVEPNHDLTELKTYKNDDELSKEDQKWWPPNRLSEETNPRQLDQIESGSTSYQKQQTSSTQVVSLRDQKKTVYNTAQQKIAKKTQLKVSEMDSVDKQLLLDQKSLTTEAKTMQKSISGPIKFPNKKYFLKMSNIDSEQVQKQKKKSKIIKKTIELLRKNKMSSIEEKQVPSKAKNDDQSPLRMKSSNDFSTKVAQMANFQNLRSPLKHKTQTNLDSAGASPLKRQLEQTPLSKIRERGAHGDVQDFFKTAMSIQEQKAALEKDSPSKASKLRQQSGVKEECNRLKRMQSFSDVSELERRQRIFAVFSDQKHSESVADLSNKNQKLIINNEDQTLKHEKKQICGECEKQNKNEERHGRTTKKLDKSFDSEDSTEKALKLFHTRQKKGNPLLVDAVRRIDRRIAYLKRDAFVLRDRLQQMAEDELVTRKVYCTNPDEAKQICGHQDHYIHLPMPARISD